MPFKAWADMICIVEAFDFSIPLFMLHGQHAHSQTRLDEEGLYGHCHGQ